MRDLEELLVGGHGFKRHQGRPAEYPTGRRRPRAPVRQREARLCNEAEPRPAQVAHRVDSQGVRDDVAQFANGAMCRDHILASYQREIREQAAELAIQKTIIRVLVAKVESFAALLQPATT